MNKGWTWSGPTKAGKKTMPSYLIHRTRLNCMDAPSSHSDETKTDQDRHCLRFTIMSFNVFRQLLDGSCGPSYECEGPALPRFAVHFIAHVYRFPSYWARNEKQYLAQPTKPEQRWAVLAEPVTNTGRSKTSMRLVPTARKLYRKTNHLTYTTIARRDFGDLKFVTWVDLIGRFPNLVM